MYNYCSVTIQYERDNASVWKPCNFDDFTGSEIIMKPKVYVVLQYTWWIADVTHARLGKLQKCTEDGAMKTNVTVF